MVCIIGWPSPPEQALRLLVHPRRIPKSKGDPLIYGDIAKNWMLHGVYSLSSGSQINPTLIRLPGYPFFSSSCFRLFGMEHTHAVMFAQVAIDLATVFSSPPSRTASGTPAPAGGSLARRALPLHRQLRRPCLSRKRWSFSAPPSRSTPSTAFSTHRAGRGRWPWPQPGATPRSCRPDGALLGFCALPCHRFYGYRRWGAASIDSLGSSPAVSSPSCPSSPDPPHGTHVSCL